MLSEKQMIDLLGGTTKAAELFGCTKASITLWKKRGIPEHHKMKLVLELEKQTNGLVNRKIMFPETYHLMWPELK